MLTINEKEWNKNFQNREEYVKGKLEEYLMQPVRSTYHVVDSTHLYITYLDSYGCTKYMRAVFE